MSLPKPGSFSRSASAIAHSEPGRINAPTNLSPVRGASTLLIVYRSMPRVSALRTRTSLNGFAVLLIAMPHCPVMGVSWTVTLSPSCLLMASTSALGRFRNSM